MAKEEQNVTNQPKTKNKWYKTWWGILLIVLFAWPFFLIWYFWAKTNWKMPIKIAATSGVLIFLIIVIGMTSSDPNKTNTVQKPAETKTTTPAKEVNQAPKYEFVNTKTETPDNNKMDLYSYSETILNLDTLKNLCKDKKQTFDSGAFYFLVVFDRKENAVFPNNPFTAEYGIDETHLSHIRAIYTYNRFNGFSQLKSYDTNAWEGTAKTEDIK